MTETNDAAGQVTLANFSASLTNIINHERGLASAPTLVLAIPPVDVVNATYPEAPYTAAQKSICASLGVLCINTQDRGTTINGANVGYGTTYNPASSTAGSFAGLWDLTGAAWPSGNAGVHPGTKGSADEFTQIYAGLVNPSSTALGIQNALAGQTNCGTTGYTYSPASGTCLSTSAAPYNPGYSNGMLCNVASCSIPDDRDVVMVNTANSTVILPVPATSVAETQVNGSYVGVTKRIIIENVSGSTITIAAGAGWTLQAGASMPSGTTRFCSTFTVAGGAPNNWYCQ